MATIAGRVFDNGTNNGIENATIVAFNRSPAGHRRVRYIGTTDNDGIYRIENLPNSIFEIKATHPNYVVNKIGGVIIDLTGTNDALGVNIPLRPKKPRTPTPPVPPPTPPVPSTPPTPTPGGGGKVHLHCTVHPQGAGTISPHGDSYHQIGTPVNIAARANSEWLFDHWIIDGVDQPGASGSNWSAIGMKMDTNHSVIAVFTQSTGPTPPTPPPPPKSTWLQRNLSRILIAFGIALFVYLVFYRPIILTGLGLYDPFTPPWWFLQVFVPLGFFFIIFFATQNMKKIEDWRPLGLSAGVFIVVFLASFLPPFRFLGGSPTIRFGVPFILALITWYIANKDKEKGLRTMIIHITSIMFLLGVLLFGINLVTSGALLQIETYLRPLDVLRVIGIPQENIDGIKEGVRSILSFLQFKGAEQEKPEAKKIGGFEAIQLKFGSTYNNFVLPTLFARMNYTLPVTVTNPNKFDTSLVVKNFTIGDIFLDNRSSERIMCGSTSEGEGEILLGDIQPEEEKLSTMDFGNKSYCIKVLDYKTTKPTNPMFPAKFRQDQKEVEAVCRGADDILPDLGGKGTKREQCKKAQCAEECSPTLSSFNQKYGLPRSTTYTYDEKSDPPKIITNPGDNPPGNELDFDPVKITGTRYIESDEQCECKVKRFYNIMDELCFLDNNKAKIELRSNYGFSVQGKGELILVKTEADRKLAPKPTITSSAGPLTVTTYFVSGVHIFEPTSAPKATKMFIQIENEGDGSAEITGVSIKEKNVPMDLPISLDSDKIKVTRCLPDPTDLTVGTETISAVCDVEITESPSFVTGSYRTVPVIVDVNYTYSQTHSTTVNVKKETIPEGVTNEDQKIELNRQFKPLPYYCPSIEVDDVNNDFDTEPLMIYNP